MVYVTVNVLVVAIFTLNDNLAGLANLNSIFVGPKGHRMYFNPGLFVAHNAAC